jgi:hypothetical protein
MSEQDMEQSSGDDPREDVGQSPVPDPEESKSGADDDPEAD